MDHLYIVREDATMPIKFVIGCSVNASKSRRTKVIKVRNVRMYLHQPRFFSKYIFLLKNECISVHHLNPDLMFTQFASTHTCPHLNIVFS
jgi:hypothetical protein